MRAKAVLEADVRNFDARMADLQKSRDQLVIQFREIADQLLEKAHKDLLVKADDRLKHIPGLVVTAEARKEDLVLAAQSGAAGYLVKPVTKATLEEDVQKIMQKLAQPA